MAYLNWAPNQNQMLALGRSSRISLGHNLCLSLILLNQAASIITFGPMKLTPSACMPTNGNSHRAGLPIEHRCLLRIGKAWQGIHICNLLVADTSAARGEGHFSD